jgi:hypothetical protein
MTLDSKEFEGYQEGFNKGFQAGWQSRIQFEEENNHSPEIIKVNPSSVTKSDITGAQMMGLISANDTKIQDTHSTKQIVTRMSNGKPISLGLDTKQELNKEINKDYG